ncbi:MAG TPA: DUF3311 domain-containing protein [Candidatus Baltobacteraceae bacterium]
MSKGARVLRVVLACLVPAMLTVGIPFANRVEPRIFGLPFLLAWIILGMILAPVSLSLIYRLEGRANP